MPKTGLTSRQIREKIIILAEKKIKNYGFHRFTLTDLARDLNISQAALYKHVTGKEALLDLISQKWLTRIDDELEKISEEQLKPDKLIVKWFINYYTLTKKKIKNDPEIYKTFNMLAQAEKHFVQNHLSRINKQLTLLVERASKQGKLTKQPVSKVVDLLLESTTMFHHPRLMVEQKEKDRTEELTLLVNTILAGLTE